ncbi:MAG: YgjP-like metallopeptidase domain-containing protein [Niameybacter sp.]|uniref:YgjP-like metallopeptidase domain-containing protein n=1 Tax=Niameybacter sp. TaxID=2033640 RepID=UPI002FC6C8E3
MKLSFNFEGTKIDYDLIYKKRTSIAINMEEDGQIKVLAPVGTPLFSVMDKVKGNATWILGELLRIQRAKEYANHSMYLGKNYGIEFVEDETKETPVVKLVRGKFVVEGQNITKETMMLPLCEWYITKTMGKLKERVKLYSEHFEKMPKKLDVKILQSRLWYIEEDQITFDVNIGVGPVTLIDSVLVEALCRFNGIEDSNSVLAKIVPESEQAREWVNINKDRFIFR